MDFGVTGIVIRLVLGIIIGFSIGLSGIGGGVLVLPSLTLILGMSASAAVGTANLYSFLTKANATYHHFRLKTIDVSTTIFFLVGAVPGVVLVSGMINQYLATVQDRPELVAQFQERLRLFIAFVVIACAVILIINHIRDRDTKEGNEASAAGWIQALRKNKVGRRVAAIVLGGVVGALIGSTSIGGGVLIVPMLIMVFGLTTRQTVGTSIAIAVVLTLVSSIIYGSSGQLFVWTAVVMAVGSLIGVPIGSRLSVKLPDRLLRAVVIAIIIVAAVTMLFKGGH